MTPLEWKVIAGLVAFVLIMSMCIGCARKGWNDANELWLLTALDPNKAISLNGRHYVAVEVNLEAPPVEAEQADYDEFPPVEGDEYGQGFRQ